MAVTRLRLVPIDIDADAIAIGMIDMFDDNERAALRFGLLPAKKMEITEKCLREKFLESASSRDGDGEDMFFALTEAPGYPRCIEFSMKKLLSEAMRLITLALYSHGNLVV